MNFEKKFSSLPQFKPEECQSPSAISVPSSPRVFVQSYRKKQSQNSHGSVCDEESESEASMLNSAKSGSGAKLIGSQFFGPDFNIDSFKGNIIYFNIWSYVTLFFVVFRRNE